MRRRTFIKQSGLAVATTLMAPVLLPTYGQQILGAIDAGPESALIYLSPIKSNGALSKCQAEVWFVREGGHRYVITDANAWRANAIRQGLNRTQVWEGDVGLWGDADGKYKSLSASIVQGSIVEDPAVHAKLLGVFGVKYSAEWDTWGPRFKQGLADSSRVLLRYALS